MLRFVQGRHHPEDKPPLWHRFSSLSLLCAYAPSALFFSGYPITIQWHISQAQSSFTAYRAVIKK